MASPNPLSPLSPASLLSDLNAGKLILNSLSGLIVITSLLLLIDAIAPTSLVNSVFTDVQAGVMTGLLFVVGSATLGLLLDSVFHTFGRWFLKQLYGDIKEEFAYRDAML